MPFFDRFWWLRLLGAVGLPILVAPMVVGLVLTDPWDLLADPDFAGEVRWILGAYAVMMVLLLVQAVSLARNAQPARDRYRRRVAALNGHQDAIPRAATIAVDASRAPNLGTSQLELLRRTTRAGRRANVALFVFICLMFGSMIALGIVVVVLALGTPPDKLFPADPLSLAESVGLLLLLLALFFVMPIALIILFAYALAATMRGRPRGVVADAEGITYHPQMGRSRRVPWGEMQLLEVSLSSSSSSLAPDRDYKLYARDAIVEWSDDSRSSRETTTGLARPEFEERHQALLDLIAARTGLLPRTFEKKLQRREVATSRQSSRFAPLANAGCLTIVLLAALGFALALILVPLSAYPPLNLLEGGALAAALVLGTSDAIIRGFAQRMRRRRPVATLDPMLSSDPGAVYVLVRRRSLPARIVSLLVALLLVVGLLPALVLWFPGVGQSLAPGADLRITDGFGVIAAYILLVCGLIGVLVVISTVTSTTTTYRAESDGLSQSTRGRERERIRWRSLADLAVWELAGSSRIYCATGSGQQQNVIWNDGPSDGRQAPNPGETLIAGEQLVEIVARRSGVSLRVSTELLNDWPVSRAGRD